MVSASILSQDVSRSIFSILLSVARTECLTENTRLSLQTSRECLDQQKTYNQEDQGCDIR